jgi:hypothetical protein
LTNTASNGGKSNASSGRPLTGSTRFTALSSARTSRRFASPQNDFRRPPAEPLLITEIAISCDMSQTLDYQMNHYAADPKQKGERFQQLTQNPKVKIGKVFAANVRKSRIHPTVKKLTA